jgi:DNA primase
VAGFRLAYVWDVAQTTGEPLPTPPTPQLLAGQAPAGLWGALARVAVERGFTVERDDCGSANGHTACTVRVRPDIDDAQAVKTLAHEVGTCCCTTRPTSSQPLAQRPWALSAFPGLLRLRAPR